MKVMLIQPPNIFKLIEKTRIFEPLALEYLGAMLKEEKHEVMVHDVRIEPDYASAFRSFRPNIVGLTGFTQNVDVNKQIAAELKLIDPKVFIIIGGHHATVRPKDFNCKDIDLVVRGEGVTALREVIKCLEEKRTFEDIPGLGIPGNEMHLTAVRPHPPLDDLPFPDRSLTSKYREFYFHDWLKPLASIRTSLGCVNRCSFCALWAMNDGRYLKRQPEKIVEELKTIQEPHVYFSDDESMLDHRRMDRLAELIKEAGIRKKYFLYARVDTIIRHPELFAKWKKIGLVQMFIGFESFTDGRLSELKKGITVKQQIKAAKICSKLKINTYGSFIVDPAFTREEFKALTSYVWRLNPTIAVFPILTPLPGTELYNARKDELSTEKPEMYDLAHIVLPTTLPVNEFYSEYFNLWLRANNVLHYLRFMKLYDLGARLSAMRNFIEYRQIIKGRIKQVA